MYEIRIDEINVCSSKEQIKVDDNLYTTIGNTLLIVWLTETH